MAGRSSLFPERARIIQVQIDKQWASCDAKEYTLVEWRRRLGRLHVSMRPDEITSLFVSQPSNREDGLCLHQHH